MSRNSMKAFEYAKEITIANNNVVRSGEAVSEFFETVFTKLNELENEAQKIRD